MKIYQVGGAVRDKLLGLPIKDRDWVVVGATAQQMLEQDFQSVGKDFPVFLHPRTKEEYALARTERKTAPGYKGFAFHAALDVTLEQDLARRDLTVNAMACDDAGQIIDPFNGRQDLKDKTLRHVSDAFLEDPVRILRLARFYARFASLGFSIATETMALMQNMVVSGEVDALVPERVWAETDKALAEVRPSCFFSVLRECGALAKLYPEIDALFGVPQPEKHHPEIDAGVHTLLVLDQAAQLSSDNKVRFAALTHDLGKGTTPKSEWPRHIGHEQRSATLAKSLCQRLRVPNEYRDLAIITAKYHTHCHRLFELKAATILKTLQAVDAFRRPERFEAFLLSCKADSRGREGYELRDYPQEALFLRLYQAANAVDISGLVQQGLSDQAFAEALRGKRIQAIKVALMACGKE